MHLGGAERSLIGLLESFDYSKVDVDLFLNIHEGELLNSIPDEVHLLPEDKKYRALAEPMGTVVKKGCFLMAVSRLFAKLKARYKAPNAKNGGISGEYSHKYTKWLLPAVCPEKEYDLAISFITPHYFTAEKVCAKKKLAWIHTDYKQIALDVPSQLKMWAPYDGIVAVSDSVKQNFVEVFSAFKDKVFVVENILPEKSIRKQALEFVAEYAEEKCIKLLSIGRFCEAKNFENVPLIAKELKRLGLDFKWYIIGYGATEAQIKENIQKEGVEENVYVLGKKANPYPYIVACDVYVQPSRYEGKAVTVREAQLLGKPVIITNFPTAKSQLEDGVDGIIVPLENAACAKGIYEFICDKERMNAIIDNVLSRRYSCAGEWEKLLLLMDDNKE